MLHGVSGLERYVGGVTQKLAGARVKLIFSQNSNSQPFPLTLHAELSGLPFRRRQGFISSLKCFFSVLFLCVHIQSQNMADILKSD
jgi:hypothetical protein